MNCKPPWFKKFPDQRICNTSEVYQFLMHYLKSTTSKNNETLHCHVPNCEETLWKTRKAFKMSEEMSQGFYGRNNTVFGLLLRSNEVSKITVEAN